MTHKNLLVGLLVTAVLLIGFWFTNAPKDGLLGAPDNRIQTNLTNTSVSVGHTGAASSTKILDADGSRQYAALCNYSGNDMTLFLSNATTGPDWAKGIFVKSSGGCYEILPENLYVGEVRGLASTTTSTVSVSYR